MVAMGVCHGSLAAIPTGPRPRYVLRKRLLSDEAVVMVCGGEEAHVRAEGRGCASRYKLIQLGVGGFDCLEARVVTTGRSSSTRMSPQARPGQTRQDRTKARHD